jgi:predicted RecA/RadA family phage recombinase
MGEVVGVALNAIANGESGAVATEGVFNLACLSTDVVAQGDVVYWDATESRLTTTASTHKCAGYAAAPSANGVATCDVKLNAFTVVGG